MSSAAGGLLDGLEAVGLLTRGWSSRRCELRNVRVGRQRAVFGTEWQAFESLQHFYQGAERLANRVDVPEAGVLHCGVLAYWECMRGFSCRYLIYYQLVIRFFRGREGRFCSFRREGVGGGSLGLPVVRCRPAAPAFGEGGGGGSLSDGLCWSACDRVEPEIRLIQG